MQNGLGSRSAARRARQALVPLSPGRMAAMLTRETSSMATWTNSQPASGEVWRRLPVTQCPGRTKRPNFLVSRWTPACG